MSLKRANLPEIKRVSRKEAIPLSYAQERLWFLDQFEGESAAYHMSVAFRCTRKESEYLKEALQHLIDRHEILRTRFVDKDGKGVQVIQKDVKLEIKKEDLRNIKNKKEQKSQARKIIEKSTDRPFNLEIGPLVRAVEISLGEDAYVIGVQLHHIISDGWSENIIVSDLSEIIASIKNKRKVILPPLKVQYADYAVWQRSLFERGGLLEKQLGYWIKELQGHPEESHFRLDYERGKEQTYRGKSLSTVLSKLDIALTLISP